MRIIFFGTPEFAIPALNSLVNFGYNVVAVVTQPEKPVGRAKVVTPSPVKKVALEKNISVLEPHNLKKDERAFENFKRLNPDLCVVAAYGKIIPKRYLDIPKHGFVNIHPSLLPKYRGPSPIQTAILNGDSKTGVTMMLTDEQVDYGPILAQQELEVPNSNSLTGEQFPNYKELEKKLAELGAELLIETLPKYVSGEIKPVPQDHSQATFTKMFTREDSRINWNNLPKKIYDQIRALNPEPGTWTMWQDKIINIKRAEFSDGKIEVQTIQMEGKKEMPLKEFLNGHPNFDISQLK